VKVECRCLNEADSERHRVTAALTIHVNSPGLLMHLGRFRLIMLRTAQINVSQSTQQSKQRMQCYYGTTLHLLLLVGVVCYKEMRKWEGRKGEEIKQEPEGTHRDTPALSGT
jgi:hypothetical protein